MSAQIPFRRWLTTVCCCLCMLPVSTSIRSEQSRATPRITTGADILVASEFAAIDGQRVGLITNQTGLVGGQHLADALHAAPNVDLVAIFAPEHGFRGAVEAGESIRDGVDTKTGVRVISLYGATKKPTARMLRNVDTLIFDIQDVGVRFYTYISTMGLAMEAAAEAGIPFLVLDRPNPLGGENVSGFMLEPKRRSFVGLYPIPVVHGLTVAELARMIQGEAWRSGLDKLDLRVIAMRGWERSMRWHQIQQTWIPTSPNIPTFNSALVYPGVGIIGETQLVNEGRGTKEPFTVFGAPWLKARRMAGRLNALGLPGVNFQPTRYRPRSIPGVAKNPAFVGQTIHGVRVLVTDQDTFQPLEVGIHALSLLIREARSRGISPLFKKVAMFDAIAGTKRLRSKLLNGATGQSIIASWRTEAAEFEEKSKGYRLY